MAEAQREIIVVVRADTKSVRALRVIFDTLTDIAEDFEYRDDVKRAVKACRWLAKHIRFDAEID